MKEFKMIKQRVIEESEKKTPLTLSFILKTDIFQHEQ